jgi:hypothetical protein
LSAGGSGLDVERVVDLIDMDGVEFLQVQKDALVIELLGYSGFFVLRDVAHTHDSLQVILVSQTNDAS